MGEIRMDIRLTVVVWWKVVEMEKPEGIYGMFWRFLAASDPCASLIVFRDTDSLLNPRERAAVLSSLICCPFAHVLSLPWFA
eukprot:1249849-Rhodomonas_salina.1